MENSAKLIEKIREKNLKPIPRWHYHLKEYLTWMVFIFCTLFGALAFSVILFAIQQVDFNLFSHMSHTWIELLLGLVPVFWIASVLIFLGLAIFSIKYSKKGYKFTSFSLVGISTALNLFIGTLFFTSGGGLWLDHVFATQVSQYESIQARKMQIWTSPENGTLSGIILSKSDDSIKLEDFKGKMWVVDYKDAEIVPSVGMNDGEKIKMTGVMIAENTFKADKIRPWGGFQKRYQGGRNKK